jgi:hypothetical protein
MVKCPIIGLIFLPYFLQTIETTMGEEPVVGAEIAPHSAVEEVLNVLIPTDESLSIKSSVITVKYFVHVTLDIPHSFDLHINLPVVLTSAKVIETAQQKNQQQQPALLPPK